MPVCPPPGSRPNDPGDMLNQWWCGAVTFNTSTGWVLYLNGEQVDTNSHGVSHNPVY